MCLLPLHSSSDTGSTTPSRYARLYPELIQVIDRMKLTTTCGMDMYKFPLERQICTVTFYSLLNYGRGKWTTVMGDLTECSYLSFVSGNLVLS